MSTETQDANATLVAEDQKELLAVATQNNLHADTALSLQNAFSPLFRQARDVIAKSQGIVVTDASQKLEIKMARACRLELKAVRVAGEKTRKEIKEESLRRSKAIDGFYSILEHLIATEETRLENQEKFAERQEQARKDAIKAERIQILTEIQIDPNLYALGDMTEETFQNLVEGTKLARAAAEERRRKEEADRIERERKDAEDRERIRQENERLKREAEERERKAAIERELAAKELQRLADERRAAEEKARAEREAEQKRKAALHAERQKIMQPFVATADESQNAHYGDLTDEQFAEVQAGAANRREARLKLEAAEAESRRRADEGEEARRKELAALEAQRAKERAEAEAKANAEQEKVAKERAAREKAEAELRAQREAEERRIAAEKEAQRKAAAAPDKDKLLSYANAIRAIEIPTFATADAQTIATTIKASRDKFASWVEEKAGAL